jgi:hypothetical protein
MVYMFLTSRCISQLAPYVNPEIVVSGRIQLALAWERRGSERQDRLAQEPRSL